MGSLDYGIDPEFLKTLAGELADVHSTGVQMGIVIGGGNIFRGVAGSAQGMDRTTADHMGMLATVMNSLALAGALEALNIPVQVQSAISMPRVAESFVRRQAVRQLEEGRVVIFAAGTGNPFFTTDTAASLRAIEIGADMLLKATKVDGVYDKDPVLHDDAVRYTSLNYDEVLAKKLRVMDATAIALSRENNLPILVFSVLKKGSLLSVLQDETLGTIIKE